jgi:hypothetical protein
MEIENETETETETVEEYTKYMLDNLKYNNANNNIVLINHLKIVIYLYLTDLYMYEELNIKSNVLKLFTKYKEYIEHDYYKFKYDIVYNLKHELTEKSKKSINEFIYPLKIKDDALISNYIYDKIKTFEIKDIKRNEEIQRYNELNKKTVLNGLYHSTKVITKNTDFNTLLHKTYSLNTMLNKLNEIKQNYVVMENLIENIAIDKSNEIKTYLEKEHCKNTIVLNIDLLKSTLNDDIINHIKSFIEIPFLDNIRKTLIQKKYFKNPTKDMKTILQKFTPNQIHNYCKLNLNTMYNLNNFTNLNNYIGLNIQYHEIYDTNILLIKKKKTLIRKLLSNNCLVNYYEFQRDMFMLNKIL